MLNQGVLFFRKRSTYMHESSVIYVCSETPILLALQHRKLQCHFLKLSRFKYSLPPYSVSNHSSSTLSPKHPLNASLSHCNQNMPTASFPEARRPSSFAASGPNTSRTKEVTCVVGDTGGKPSTSVLTLVRLLITGLTVLLTADSLLCLL